MEEELRKRLDHQEELLKEIYLSTEKTRKYFLWTFIISLLVFILPLLGLILVLPKFLSTYSSLLEGL